MNVPLEDFNRQEAERLATDARQTIERRAAREKSLTPAFEAARFVGLSSNMPTNAPFIFDVAIANFEGREKFSLFVPTKEASALEDNSTYLVGFTPMNKEEHKSATAMQFYINSMDRPSPIMGEMTAATSVPAGVVKALSAGGMTPSLRE